MSYIRDVRNKYDQSPYKPDSKEPNPYYEEYLNEKDREFLRGYDWALEQSVDHFFNNLDLFEDGEFEKYLNSELPEELKDQYEMEYRDGSKEVRKVVTYADYMRMKLLEFAESDRNSLVTSMLDEMDHEEYEKNFNAFWKKEGEKTNE